MNLARVTSLLLRDLRTSPRSSVFLYALVMPVLMTFLIQVVLAAVLDPVPRLGIADLGASGIPAAVGEMEGLDLTLMDDGDALRRAVRDHDLDAGLVLPPGFDEAIRTGERPELELFFSGESAMVNRIVLLITALDLVREVEDKPAPAEVVLVKVGDKRPLPIEELAVLGILMWALVVTGMFVTGSMVVEEKEHGTLQAMLVTPMTMTEVLTAKGVLGLLICVSICTLTLVLNGALESRPWELAATLGIAALICTEIGLIYGAVARNAKMLYNLVQTLNFIVLCPLFFYFFPRWPQWPAKLFPSYWFIDPLYRVALKGATLSDVWTDLVLALVVAAALAVPVVLLGRRMARNLAAT